MALDKCIGGTASWIEILDSDITNWKNSINLKIGGTQMASLTFWRG